MSFPDSIRKNQSDHITRSSYSYPSSSQPTERGLRAGSGSEIDGKGSSKKRKLESYIPSSMMDPSKRRRIEANNASSKQGSASQKNTEISVSSVAIMEEAEREETVKKIRECRQRLSSTGSSNSEAQSVILKKDLYKHEYELARDNHLKSLQENLVLVQKIQTKDKHIQDKDDEIARLNLQILALRQKETGLVEEHKKELSDLNKEFEHSKRINYYLNKAREEALAKKDEDCRARLIAVQDDMQKKHETQLIKLNSDQTEMKKQLDEAKNECEHLKEQVTAVQEKFERFTQEKQQEQRHLESLKQEVSALQKILVEKDAELHALKVSLSHAVAKSNEARENLKLTDTKYAKLQLEMQLMLYNMEQQKQKVEAFKTEMMTKLQNLQ